MKVSGELFNILSRYICALAVSFVLAACGNSAQDLGTELTSNNKLVITGSSTVAPLALEIAKKYEKMNPGVRIDVQSGGSSRGIADVRQGLADIGMVSRDLKENEMDLLPFALARDGIGIILHNSNGIESLSDQQVVDIFTGKISNWKQLGGNDLPITVVNKAEGRSTLELFLTHFKLNNSDINAHVIIGDNEQGIKTVAGNPNAIGYVSIGTAEYDMQNAVPIKLLQLDGVKASTEYITNGKYPLSRVLNFVTNGQPQGLSKDFIDFARSGLVADIVEEQSFVALAR